MGYFALLGVASGLIGVKFISEDNCKWYHQYDTTHKEYDKLQI